MSVELRSLGFFPYNAPLTTSHGMSHNSPNDMLPAASTQSGHAAPLLQQQVPLQAGTSSLLKICSWAMVNLCEGQSRPPCPLEYLLPVLSALMDSPDAEVQVGAP